MKAIVIAWVEMDGGVRETDHLERFDGVNWRYKLERCPKGQAVIFSRDMSEVNRAKDYVKAQFGGAGKVMVMDDTDDILKKARQAIVSAKAEGKG